MVAMMNLNASISIISAQCILWEYTIGIQATTGLMQLSSHFPISNGTKKCM